MSERWSRRNVIATIVVGLLGCIVTLVVTLVVYPNNDQEKEIGTPITKSSESPKEAPPTVSITSIYVSDVAMDIPAVFEIGVEIGGFSNQPARNFNVMLDFGRAEVQVCGFTPKHAIKTIVNDDRNYRRLEITELRKNESLYIRCLISSPEFKKVVIEGGNIYRTRSIDFSEYQASLLPKSSNPSNPSNELGFWGILWRAIVVFVVVMIGRVIYRNIW